MQKAVRDRDQLNKSMVQFLQQVKSITVHDFGSSHPWSDVDYQVSFDLVSMNRQSFTLLCDQVDMARGALPPMSANISTDNYIEVPELTSAPTAMLEPMPATTASHINVLEATPAPIAMPDPTPVPKATVLTMMFVTIASPSRIHRSAVSLRHHGRTRIRRGEAQHWLLCRLKDDLVGSDLTCASPTNHTQAL